MSKIVEDKLYLTFNEMVDCGVSENYLRKAKSIKTKCWSFINDPEDKRKVLVEFEALKDEYKEKVKARFGNPYERQAKQPIRDMIKWSDEAEKFYLAYRFTAANGEEQPLPIGHVKKYTGAVNFLNMLKEVTEDKRALKDLLKLTLEQFYNHCLEIIEQDKIDLPTSYRRLLAKRKEYEEKGYASLVSWKFGNQAAAKVNDEVAEGTLLSMIAHANQYDDVFISMQYNKWAVENNRKAITPATVGVRRRSNYHNLMMEREGNAGGSKYLKQAKGVRPSTPLLLIENDDNVLDLLFNDPENARAEKRYVAMVVTDSYNDYVLGKAYALVGTLNEGQSIMLVKAAYIDAMYHIKSLTGKWMLFDEVKADNWGMKSLKPFYDALGKREFIQTPVGSKNRGYIEQLFGNIHWKRCLKIGANNYSGNNITAKHRGVNMEVLARNKKERPLIGNEAQEQIESFFYRLRHMPQSNGVSKHQQWLEGLNQITEDKKRVISDEQFLLKFGIEHNPGMGKQNRISNRGVEPQIAGVQYSYDIDGNWRPHEGKAVKIIYDPFDMSRVLITDFDKVRMMGYSPNLSPRALADAHTNSRTFLNAVLNEKRDAVEEISARIEKRNKILSEANQDFEAVLQSGMMLKAPKQAAETKMLEQMINGKTEKDYYLDQL